MSNLTLGLNIIMIYSQQVIQRFALVIVLIFWSSAAMCAQSVEMHSATSKKLQEHQIKTYKQHPETGRYTLAGCLDCKERCDLRTATTRTFQRPDGTQVVQRFKTSVHYLKDGVWLSLTQPNSNSLH